MKKIVTTVASCLLFTAQAYAVDYIETNDGARLTGTISAITADTVVLQTSYAGEITLQRNKVTGFSSEQALAIRLNSGTTLSGLVAHNKDGALTITANDAQVMTRLEDIAESWLPTQQDPYTSRLEQQKDALKRKWAYKAGVDIVGKKGNSDKSSVLLSLAATLTSQEDTLKFYGSLDKAKNEGQETANEIILGTQYTAYFSDPLGWYIRGEVEQDDFESLDLRTIVGAGLNYRVFATPEHTLELRSGLGYRFESFNDGSHTDAPTLDFGLDHSWQFSDWGKMSNKLSYAPAVSEFSDYLLTHDSGLDIPLGLSDQWQLRLGVRHDYKSKPSGSQKSLDTSYYSRLQLNWQ